MDFAGAAVVTDWLTGKLRLHVHFVRVNCSIIACYSDILIKMLNKTAKMLSHLMEKLIARSLLRVCANEDI